MTEHANENLSNYSKLVPSEKVQKLLALIDEVINLDGSTACIVPLDNPIENPHRNNWEPNDVLSAIVRDNTVVTIMLTRKSQVNRGHFRTEFVIS